MVGRDWIGFGELRRLCANINPPLPQWKNAPDLLYSNFSFLRLKQKKSREFYMDAFLERSKYLT